MSQGASVDGNAWEAFASSALSAYFIVNGGTAEYELTGSVQVSGYQGSTWNLDAIVVFNSSQGPIINAVAGGCHRPEGCAPATVPLSGSGTIAPGIYSIGGILRAGTGSITPDARSGTAQFTYQLTLRP